jgi:RimJ/RimL family protein N-acetyltransferase
LDVPVIETERLILRGHRADDLGACAAMWADPEVTRFIGGKPSAPDESWSRLLRYAGHWTLLGFGYWVLEEKSSGHYVGETGFADFKRPLEPALNAPEIGWVISPSAHGKGFATEAVRAAIAWGDAHFRPRRTACLIAPENGASLNVARKCGYVEFARTTFKASPTILLERV